MATQTSAAVERFDAAAFTSPAALAPGSLLTIEGLSVDFNGVRVLRGIDLALARGEALGIVGESGSGKSVTWLAAGGGRALGRRRLTARPDQGRARGDDLSRPVKRA